jgi:hypothetical protein
MKLERSYTQFNLTVSPNNNIVEKLNQECNPPVQEKVVETTRVKGSTISAKFAKSVDIDIVEPQSKTPTAKTGKITLAKDDKSLSDNKFDKNVKSIY